MHVFLITQYFPPEIGAAATRWGDYTNILVKQGHRVTVLCEMPNYPIGRYFPGYKRQWVKREYISPNLTVIRSFTWATDRRSIIKKLGNYLIFMLSGLINALKIKNYDILIISSPPLFAGVIGAIIAKIKSIHFFLDIRDLWPESVKSLGEVKSRVLINLGRKLESFIYKTTTGYILAVPGFKKYFTENHPSEIKKSMVELINGVSDKFIELAQLNDRIPDKKFTVLYSGNMGLAQGLDTVIQAANILQKYPINFLFVGNGVKLQSLEEKSNQMELDNISFMPPQRKEDLIQIIKKSSVCLVPLKNEPLFRHAIPSKLFEYMACSRPVIIGIKGEIEKIIKKANSGLMANPQDADSLVKQILYYYNDRNKIDNHGQNGVIYVTENVRKETLLSDALFNIMKMNVLNIKLLHD